MAKALKVLVVDDSRSSRLLTRTYLQRLREDVVIVEAPDGDGALEQLAEQTVDAAILDMNMPGMTGLELSEVIAQRFPQIWMALLTANVQDAVQERARKQGVHFFRKPITEKVITQILEAYTFS